MANNKQPIDSIFRLGKVKGLKFLSLNVRSLLKKIDQCRVWCGNLDVDIISFSETWLNTSIPNPALEINGFHCLRQDRNFVNTRKKRGGALLGMYTTVTLTRYKNFLSCLLQTLTVRRSGLS